jgi:hypothetical protein
MAAQRSVRQAFATLPPVINDDLVHDESNLHAERGQIVAGLKPGR